MVCFPSDFAFVWERVSVIYGETLSLFSCPFSGQITQWNLIFHGTNEPPQRNDEPRVGKKKTVNDLVHNSLENSQWGFITQDVSISRSSFSDLLPLLIKREANEDHNLDGNANIRLFLALLQVTDADAHLEVQRTVDGERTTSSACLRFSDKNYCLGLCLFIVILINVLGKAR